MTCDKKKAPSCYGGLRNPKIDAENDCENCSLNAECLGVSRQRWLSEVSRDTTALSIKKMLFGEKPKVQAVGILAAAADHMVDRAKFYDQPKGERSMAPTVAAFNAITGLQLSEEQGWLFMELLKCVRAEHNGYRPDNYEDGAAYVALKGEAAARNRGESST